MAKLWYQLGGPGQINVYSDPQVLNQANLQTELATFQAIQGLDDQFRTWIASSGLAAAGIPGGFPDLQSFDDFLDDEVDRLADVLDYFDYEARQESITVRDGDWFVPEAVESVSDEFNENVAARSIDGDNATWWQSNATGERSIVYRVRSYRKRMSEIRLRISGAGEGRTQLQGLTVRASAALGQIDAPGNVMASGVDLSHDGDAWLEVAFASPKRARFIKLETSGSLHSNPDQVRIREIQVRVGVTNHDK